MPPAPPPTPNAKQKAQAQQQNQSAGAMTPAQQKAYAASLGKQRGRNELYLQKKQLAAQNRQARMSSRQVVRGALTVQGAIVGCLVSTVILLAIMVSLGPLIDFFQAWLMNQPGNPYAAPILDMFPWIYIFIFASWITSIIVIWRAVTAFNDSGVYD